MEIKRIGENKIRCALTETEIREMGFDIDDIIGNSEVTQRFMRDVLSIVEQQEDIRLDNVAPMVKAELLQDHSMALTFGGDSDMSFKSLVDTVNHLMSQMEPTKLEEFKTMSREEKQAAVDEFLERFGAKQEHEKKSSGKKKVSAADAMICALRFGNMNTLIETSKVCFPEKLPKSCLYKLEDAYYLVLDFTGFAKEEMRPFAFGAVEYDEGHFSEASQVAYIQEHGDCIMRNDALEMLMQL